MTPRVCAAIVLLATSGCSYDWSVAAASPDAGAPIDATVPVDSAVPAVDGSDGAPNPVVDAGADAPPSCAELLAAADTAYTSALACTALTQPCTSMVTDPCGCSKPVGSDSSAATNAYEQAVAAIVDAGCHPSCGTCPTSNATCLPAGADGGITPTCQ